MELTNFLSYRETAVLSFDGIHLACISGPNGAGKSSILDAITWSLFGRSRSRSDDDLVNRFAALQGEAAEVRFTFSLEQSIYRVLRRKRIGKSSVLELQISTGSDSWKTLSENKIRETQAAIEQLLKMNYDTFTNASLLLQGKADEFTTRTPNQRKEILADLLGVTEWENYRELAAEARKIEQGKLALLDSRLEDIIEELSEEPQRKTALEEALLRRDRISAKLKMQEKLLNQMRQTSAAASKQETLVANLGQSVDRINLNLGRSRRTIGERRAERETYQSVISKAETIEAEFAAWQTAIAESRSWQEKANGYNRLLQEKRPYEITLAQSRSRLEQQQKQLEDHKQRVSEALIQRPVLQNNIKARENRLDEIKTSLAKLAEVQDSLHAAKAELQQIIGERHLLQQELDQLTAAERRIQILEADRVSISENKIEAELRLKTVEEELGSINKQQDRYIELKAELDAIKSQQPLLRQKMDKLKDRIDRLQEIDRESKCPLCGQPLTEEHRRQVIHDLSEEGKERADLWRSNSGRLSVLDDELPKIQLALKQKPLLERDRKAQQQRLAQADAKLVEIDQRVQQWEQGEKGRLLEINALLANDSNLKTKEIRVLDLEKQLKPRAKLQDEQQIVQTELSNAGAQITSIDRLISEWEKEGQATLLIVQKQLQEETFEPEARAALANLQTKIDAVGYDSIADQTSQEKRDALGGAEIRFQELKQAEAALKPLEITLSDLEQSIQDQEATLDEQKLQFETAKSQLESLKAGIVDMQTIEDQTFQLRDEEIAATRQVGAAEQKLAVLDDLRKQRKQIKRDKATAALRIQRIKLLEKSCGRGGVQALIIEHALPEIEERANELLDRLTGGDMSIYFETQRKLKTRDALSETLDIRIADKDGERPYDNYSGGEQFRVNFAIRLALSQLLTKRAGARLQTLIIDEGFGSQDPQGRQKLVEAINTVRDEFACILVITHIDELRDAFPTRIEVSKTLNGSNFKVI